MTAPTRDEKIEAVCAAMENWDLDTLIGWAKDQRAEQLSLLADSDLNIIYSSDVLADQAPDEEMNAEDEGDIDPEVLEGTRAELIAQRGERAKA